MIVINVLLIILIVLLYIILFGSIIGFCVCRKSPKLKRKLETFLSNEYTFKPFTEEERIKYYLGNLSKNIYIKLYDKTFNSKIELINKDYEFDQSNNYINEMENFYKNFKRKNPQYFDKQFIFLPGDVSHSRKDVPMLTKTRPINNKGLNVLLPLNNRRHWGPVFQIPFYDIPYNHKKNIIVWRGVATGRHKRIPLVEKYYNYPGFQIDVGFTGYSDNYRGERNNRFIKNKLHMGEMLQCKFILSVEGNDVASNLKWIMASNSLCIRPHSTMESWLMEGTLKPWIHYVPVKDDFSDLLDVYEWCLANPEKCKQIVKNCNIFISQFMNSSKEEHIIQKVLEGYASYVDLF